MTQDQLTVLKEYERHFDAAIDGNYLRGLTGSDLHRLHAVWEEITGKEYHLNENCGNCIYELIRTAGMAYRAELAKTPAPAAKPTAKKGKR